MRDELVNELSGEVMTLREYVDRGRALERAIFRLDNSINDLKSSLKAAKEEKLKAIAELRSNAREVRLRSRPTAITRTKRVQTPALPPRARRETP